MGCLFGAMYFIQGIGEPTAGLIAQPAKSLLKSWGLTTGEIGTFMFFVGIPWMLKPLYGMISDFVPLGGSRRKSYLLLTSAFATAGLLVLSFLPLSPNAKNQMLLLLLAPSLGLAFSDVVIDALMVEVGQPQKMTGRLQSIQWAAIYSATILTGFLGGWLTEQHLQRLSFVICAMACAVSFFLVLMLVREPPPPRRESFLESIRPLGQAARNPAFLVAALYLFLWNFNPFSATVLYIYETEILQLSEQFSGNMQSVLAGAAVLASLTYGFYCRRVPFRWLIHLSIVMGILATLAYIFLEDQRTAFVIALVSGFTYMTGTLIQLDLAARICPPQVAGTVFALLMSLSNLGTMSSDAVGSRLFDDLSAWLGHHRAYDILVCLGAAFTAGCWLLMPWLKGLDGTATDADSAEIRNT